MREVLRIVGLVVLLAGGMTILALTVAQSFDTSSPAIIDWERTADIRRWAWIAAGGLYVLAGLALLFLRRWSAVFFIVGAVVAAASMVYDLAAYAQFDLDALGVSRIRSDIVSLVCALALTGLTVPLVWRRVLK